jgi:arginyl-tRNA synthetase
VKEALREIIERSLRALLDAKGDTGELPEIALEVPKNPDHGDFACNAAFVLAKRLGEPPRAIAERLAETLAGQTRLIASAEVAGPGFVNIRLSGARWHDLLRRVLAEGPRFGHSDVDAGKKFQVEFVSANPTGPLTLGHGRQAVLGDAIARLLAARGAEVTREYYFNNGGRQMRVLGQSVCARYLEQLGRAAPPPAAALADPEGDWPEEIDGRPVRFPRDGYQGEYVAQIAAEIRRENGDGLGWEAADGLFREAAETRIFADIRQTLRALGIEFDVYSNEMTLYEEGKIEATLGDLRARGLVYDEDGAVWLRATKLGLDRDRVLVKGTGEPTYLLPDIAYHREKFRRGFDRVVDVQGADHIEQFPFVREAVGALGCPADRVELVMHQFVTLNQGGEQVKQSTRLANYVTVDELLEEIDVDVFRFFMVQRRAEGHLDFDLGLAKETDWKKNPAYYVQYAETREPHHVAYYARDLAGLWSPYVQDGVRHRVLSDDASLTSARLGLARAVRTVLANALDLLGLSAPEQM